MKISEAFDLKKTEDIRAMGFVVKLSEVAEAESSSQRKLAEEYVFTPTVRQELPKILGHMEQVYKRGEDYGCIIQGSFGSGKSHFLSVASLLFENADAAWEKDDPAITEILGHRGWISEANLLVVRTHMLGGRGRDMGLDRILYESFKKALQRKGKEPFAILNVDGVIEEVKREAELYGDEIWEKLAEAGIIGGPEDLTDLDAEEREDFAKAYLKFKGRDPSSSGLEPVWTEGLHRLAKHAQAEGFGGVVFMLDEMLLWLTEKTGSQFKQEIHDLNLMVDHQTARRAVPIFVFVARQRNIRDFFPELTAEDDINEHLDHHAERFVLTELQDVELRHIVRGRMLKPRDPEKLAAEIEDLVEAHRSLLPTLLHDAEPSYLKDVYPFHPALIEALVDVSAAMQRERSALRLLYEMLNTHRDMEVGKFLPVGSAFDAIFPPQGVEASKNEAKFKEIHKQYHHYVVPAMDQLHAEGELDDEARRMLDQLVKTVLLSEVSLRLRSPQGISIRRLVGLNVVDVEGATERVQTSKAEKALNALSRRLPALQIAGNRADAIVSYTLSTVSLGEFLSQAQAKVQSYGTLWTRLWLETIRPMLGLEEKKGFEGWNLPQSGPYPFKWKKTQRSGVVQLCNVRSTKYDDFVAPPKAFRVLIDYPWDKDGHTVDEDRQRAANARKQYGVQSTVCWLPRHFEKQEREIVDQLCAVRYLLSDKGKEELLADLGQQDRQTVLNEAETRNRNLTKEYKSILARVYVDQGELLPLNDGIDTKIPIREDLGKNLDRFAEVLLDRSFPAHPTFRSPPTKKDLETLTGWLVRASEAGTSSSIEFDDAEQKVLQNLGEPLELVDLGQSRGMLRLTSRYYRAVEKVADNRSEFPWSDVRAKLEEDFGLDDQVMDVLLCLFCARGYRPLRDSTREVVEVGIGMSRKETLQLERANILQQVPWGRVRDLAVDLLGLDKPSAYRSISEQDTCARLMQEHGRQRRKRLSELHKALVEKSVPNDAKRLQEIRESRKRLEPLEAERTDSFVTLTEFLDQWDEDAEARLKVVVARCEKTLKALQNLDVQDRTSLENGRSHAEHGSSAAAHLEKLEKMLAASEHGDALTGEKVRQWNDQAHAIVQQLITSQVAAPKGDPNKDVVQPDTVPSDAVPSAGTRQVVTGEPLDLSSASAVDDFVDALRTKLRSEPPERVLVDVTLHREGGE